MRGSDFPYGDYQLKTPYDSNKYVKYSDTNYVPPFELLSASATVDSITCSLRNDRHSIVGTRSMRSSYVLNNYYNGEDSFKVLIDFRVNYSISGTVTYNYYGEQLSQEFSNTSYLDYEFYYTENRLAYRSSKDYVSNDRIGEDLDTILGTDKYFTKRIQGYSCVFYPIFNVQVDYQPWIFSGVTNLPSVILISRLHIKYNVGNTEQYLDADVDPVYTDMGYHYSVTTNFSKSNFWSWCDQVTAGTKDSTWLKSQVLNGTSVALELDS